MVIKSVIILAYFTDYLSNYMSLDFLLEVTAAILGLISVWLTKQDNVWLYPFGIISTGIYVYLMLQVELIGLMLVNGYYFAMSFYGWVYWTRKQGDKLVHPIQKATRDEMKKAWLLFIFIFVAINLFYLLSQQGYAWVSVADVLSTAFFFSAMWLMARHKLEHWILWIVGDTISTVLNFHKALFITSLQYFIFTCIAVYGFFTWRKILESMPKDN